MTRPTQGTGGPDGRPRCWNAEPMTSYLSAEGQIPWFGAGSGCKSWAGTKGTKPVPMAERWKCAGCRHLPHADVAAALRGAMAQTLDPALMFEIVSHATEVPDVVTDWRAP